MPTQHTVVEGDGLTSLADGAGFYVLTIWNDAANDDLRKKRSNMDILLPGDVVTIPDKRIVPVNRPTDRHHRFKRRGIPAEFRMQVFEGELPRANEDYLLTIGDQSFHGKTDDRGVLFRHIPANTKEARLLIGTDRQELILKFGSLDPQDEVIGVQKRLNNIGFDCGEPTGEMNDATRKALLAFQRRFSLEQTGRADAATQSKLRSFNDAISQFPKRPLEDEEDADDA
ncbi:MAG TPA: peptidoglycan-binding domain-containing protein [Acetobacteraceae bacterium]|nr:peptidoglycan-binding domain-containing protein [Acetobacteraceae bacterium]